jgi:hypothetical protein
MAEAAILLDMAAIARLFFSAYNKSITCGASSSTAGGATTCSTPLQFVECHVTPL